MPTLMVFHEVDDVEHWLASPIRREVFGPLGITMRTFVDPAKSNRVGLVVTAPDMETFETARESAAAAEAMSVDGARAETLFALCQS